MGPEKTFENKVKKFLKEKGCWYVKYWGGGDYTRAGVPDLLCCINGRFVGLELKSDAGIVSDLQVYQIEKINDAGGLGIVLYPSKFDWFKRLVEELLKT